MAGWRATDVLLNPSILALLAVSLVVSGLMVMATVFALRVLRHWDLGSGSERQLRLERRTYLIATLVAFSFVAEVVSLLLFVYNAEALHTQFVGAMCATGVLNANAWGWPTLVLKIAAFFAGAAWLTLNRLDNRGWDYPLIRLKYGALLVFDYGDRAEGLEHRRVEGTVRTYRGHHLGPEPLAEPGATDITLDVNFSALVDAAGDAEVMRQDEFLERWGLRDRLDELRTSELDAAREGRIMEQLILKSRITEGETLLHPRGLGDFRVLVARH